MEHGSGTTPAATGHGIAPSVQEDDIRAEGFAMEAPPLGLLRAKSQGAERPVRIDKDIVDECRPLERQDTTESCLSEFGPPRRTNTGWSVAGSTATDLTDLNSPDVAFADEGLNFEPESYASSPRRSSLFPYPMPFQKRFPPRGPSISNEIDACRTPPYGSPLSAAAPVPQNHWLGQMTSRKSSFGRNPFGAPSAPNPHATKDTPENGSAREQGVEDELGGEEETDDNATVEDDAPTPGASDDAAFEEQPESRCYETPDLRDDGDALPAPDADDGVINEVCGQILQQAFGVQLHDLALAGAVSAAYESVGYCLDELSHIVLNSGLSSAGIVISESARGRSGSSATPIWPAGGAADSVGGIGGGHGDGGGSRKRPNGGHDSADSGDGTGDGSPGDGKRQKISPTRHSSADMQFSCPFRKRNPVRFNIRASQSCAVQSFPDVPQLKRHVKNFHKQRPIMPFTCQRCRQAMGSQAALDAHISVERERICNPHRVSSSADPEDGITSGMEEVLNGRKADRKIDSWESLWRLLFPADLEVPEPDFIPPTELDEVYARFSSGDCTHQLRQRIQESLGPTGNAESMFSVFTSHVELVFEACRRKTSGRAGGRKHVRPQTLQQVTSRGNRVRLNTGQGMPGYQGSGISESSISSPVATPSSTNMPASAEQSLEESRPNLPYEQQPICGFPETGADGAAGRMIPLVVGNRGGQPVTVPAPAHLHVGFGSQEQDSASQLGHHPRLLSMDSGVDLGASFPEQAAGFSTAPSFASQNSFPNLTVGWAMPDLSLRPVPQDMQEVVPGPMFSSVDSNMVPQITFYDVSAIQEAELEDIRRGGEWM